MPSREWYLARLAELGAEPPPPPPPREPLDALAQHARLEALLAEAPTLDEQRQRNWLMTVIGIGLGQAETSLFKPLVLAAIAQLAATDDGIDRILHTVRDPIENEQALNQALLTALLPRLEALVTAARPTPQRGAALALACARSGDVRATLGWIAQAVATASSTVGEALVDAVGDLPSAWPHADLCHALAAADVTREEQVAFGLESLPLLARVEDPAQVVPLLSQILYGLEHAGADVAAWSAPALAIADAAGDSPTLGAVLRALAAAGRSDDAERALAERRERLAGDFDFWRTWYGLAQGAARAGDEPTARRALAEALALASGFDVVTLAAWAARAGYLDIAESLARNIRASSVLTVVDGVFDGVAPDAAKVATIDRLLALAPPDQYTRLMRLRLAAFAIASGVGDAEAHWRAACELAGQDEHYRGHLADRLLSALSELED